MTLTYIIVAVIAVLVGWVIGFFDSNIRTASKIKEAELKAENVIRDFEIKAAQAKQTPHGQKDDPGLLRMKKENDQLKIEMDGASITDSISSDQRKRLIELVSLLRPWLEGKPAQQAAPAPATPVQVSRPPAPAQQAVARSESKTAPLGEAVSKNPAEAKKNLATLSIVQQIDSVLQEQLMSTHLSKKGIRLQESPEGGVEVYVGLNKFATIDDVPDAEIKTAIRTAIAVWENKYTFGK
ncbi:MAG: hypothetical protein KA473_13030 [Anaerolineales bacterium]|nr:hypothetical protein [Anaerolineales bacterium]